MDLYRVLNISTSECCECEILKTIYKIARRWKRKGHKVQVIKGYLLKFNEGLTSYDTFHVTKVIFDNSNL